MGQNPENLPYLFGDLAAQVQSGGRESTMSRTVETPPNDLPAGTGDALPAESRGDGATCANVEVCREISGAAGPKSGATADVSNSDWGHAAPPPIPGAAVTEPGSDEAYDAVVAALQKARRERRSHEKKEKAKARDQERKPQEHLGADVPRLLFSVAQIADLFGVSEQTIWRWVHEVPDFPRQFRVGKATRWLANEIDGYIRKQAEARQ